MRVYLVHHGDAVAPSIDPQRPLSDEGRIRVERLAEHAARRDVKPSIIWHSGKLRARQTANAYWRACNPRASLSAARGLQPADAPGRIANELAAEALGDQPRDIMVVGHMPHLEQLLRVLVGGRGGDTITFPPHGIVALEPDGHNWAERWRSEDDTGQEP